MTQIIKNDEIRETKHLIVYIDLLGIKEKLNQCEEVRNAVINSLNLVFDKWGRAIENSSAPIKYKVFSDNIVFALDCSNPNKSDVSTFLFAVCLFQIDMLCSNKFPSRGGIAYGGLYIDDKFILGEALNEAYYLESNVAIYPRIIVSKSAINFFDTLSAEAGDWNIKEDRDGVFFLDCFFVANGQQLKAALDDAAENYDAFSKNTHKYRIAQKWKWIYNQCVDSIDFKRSWMIDQLRQISKSNASFMHDHSFSVEEVNTISQHSGFPFDMLTDMNIEYDRRSGHI